MRKLMLFLAACFFSGSVLFAKGDDSLQQLLDKMVEVYKQRDSVRKALKYETGIVNLPSGVARLNVPEGFKYLGAAQSRFVIEDLWGNLPQQNLQGMLFPANGDPYNDSSYAYIIEYNPVGYVKDGDARDINYDDMMKDMKKDDVEANKQRAAIGGEPMFTEGWAARPFYDENKKILHWALDIRVEGAEENTLNYKVIHLGRKGILTMSAVSRLSLLPMVKEDVDKVINMAEYTEGNKYADFDSKVDNVAAWTVGGLVAGKVLLKTAAGAGILKFLKFIIIGLVAAGGGIWRWITGRKKKEEEYVYEPQTAPVQATEELPGTDEEVKP